MLHVLRWALVSFIIGKAKPHFWTHAAHFPWLHTDCSMASTSVRKTGASKIRTIPDECECSSRFCSMLNAQCSLPNPTFQARTPLPESPQRNETPWSSSTAWGGGTKDPSFKSHWGLSIKGKGGLLKEVVGRSCVPFPLLTGRIFYCCYCLVPLRVGGVPCSSNHAEALVGNWRPRLSQDATVPRITGLPVYAANRVIVFTHSLTGTKCHGGILPDSSGHPWLMFLHCGWFERI